MLGLISAIDAEHVEQVIRSRGYVFIAERLRDTMHAQMAELIKDQPEASTAKLRGAIEALDLARKIPQMLIEEWRRKQGN